LATKPSALNVTFRMARLVRAIFVLRGVSQKNDESFGLSTARRIGEFVPILRSNVAISGALLFA